MAITRAPLRRLWDSWNCVTLCLKSIPHLVCTANRLNHKTLWRWERRGKGNTSSLTSSPKHHPPLGARWLVPHCHCHQPAPPDPAGKALVSLPACEPTQLSWQAGKGKRAGCIFSSSGARRKEKLKAAKSYWNANCSQCTLGSSKILSTSDTVDQTGSYLSLLN